MLGEFKDWVKALLPTYFIAVGKYVENKALDDRFIAVVVASGGPSMAVETRYPVFKLYLIGPRHVAGTNDANAMQYSQDVLRDLNTVIEQSTGDFLPCGAAHIEMATDIIGPGFTTENRAWVTADFRILL